MSMTDPIADMLTRIRNACAAKHRRVDIPVSRVKTEIARILKENNFIQDYSMIDTDDGKRLPHKERGRAKRGVRRREKKPREKNQVKLAVTAPRP